ncbi:ABC-type glycerol-3-phosphate transport system substrate-binding protein [Kribbella orskensis]|uniref:ABC-type glycerol-3-phosphate transport system substrate-binding protein n=1 Tax=Kribbella orskensis TaxID=2512216 RepID=A0ABY2BLQ3_9ACTN|nr:MULTISPECIES: extracellular solute-binding protein [Kribbella]TCN40815.1 ABC-type glycerol-3-phosphate transport system substrate-binding protein [Kribbella sp. VKM Ac-2500]TCO24067.1 ABC-type glycerol-3-phosphate transport system substrate-binding protein [Kribbella orskensis]
MRTTSHRRVSAAGWRRPASLLLVAGLGLAAASCGSGDEEKPTAQGSAAADAPVTITVGCQPPKSNPKERAGWDEDVAAFQKLHPNITIQSKDAFPCINPDTFQAKLAGGTQEDVFYVYYTDVQKIIRSKQAADISEYVGSVKALNDIRPDVQSVFKDGDKTYGLPRNNYNMGLVYNRKLFTQAGLNPDSPPKTWAEVQEAARKIAAIGPGYTGFGEYSAGNTGGWHFAASLYARGGSMVSDDGKSSAFNSAEGKAVLENLKQMRWNDNSMGSKQLLQWEDLMRMMGSGKLGMMIGAPDVVQSVNNDFQGKFEDYGVTAVPESEGKASLSGGDGYMFNPKATPEKIKAGLLWLEFHELTPGKGQFNYDRAKAQGRPVGLPIPDLYGDSAPGQEITALRKQFATVPVDHFTPYVTAQSSITNKLEPPKAQELYAVLDVAMSAVLTRKDADIDKLLSDAASKADKILAKNT